MGIHFESLIMPQSLSSTLGHDRAMCQIVHVTNVRYYSFFDAAVNQFLIAREVLDIRHACVS